MSKNTPASRLDELVMPDRDTTIEPVSASVDLSSEAATEAFMSELVTIFIHESTNENDNPYVVLNVNGTNQLVLRGVEAEVKRKYVEVLARMKESKYTQKLRNPNEPDSTYLHERQAHVYPFDLVKDSARGRAWLSHIMKQAV